MEWDKYACRVLRERVADGWFPDMQVYEGDVRLFDPSEYKGRVDCIHAGFPCTDLSVAGKQAGLGEGTRSGLYREVLRIAGIVRPRYLFLENVAAILTVGGSTVVADLAAMGFSARWGCIRASDCGANHRRDRWFLLANSNLQHGIGWGESQQPASDSGKSWDKPSGCGDENMAYTSNERLQRSQAAGNNGKDWKESRNEQPAGQCKGNEWNEVKSSICCMANGIPVRMGKTEGEINATTSNCSARQNMQSVRENIQSESNAERKVAGFEVVSQTGTLQSELREYQRDGIVDEAWILIQGKEASEGFLRGLRIQESASCSPHRSGQNEQRAGEHPDSMQALPQLLAHDGEKNWKGNSGPDASIGWWDIEPNIGRVSGNVSNRVGQLKGYGNAQVPLQAAVAFKLLMDRI